MELSKQSKKIQAHYQNKQVILRPLDVENFLIWLKDFLEVVQRRLKKIMTIKHFL
jgi:hypothetical protein